MRDAYNSPGPFARPRARFYPLEPACTCMPEFVLKLHDIDDQGKEFFFPVTAAWLDHVLADTSLRRDPAAAEGALELRAQRNDGEILVDGRVRAGLLTECSRCLGDALLPVDTRITALLSRTPSGDLADELELSADDLDRQAGRFEGDTLVLDELVREHLVLECPMQPLCSEACQGIEVPAHIRPKAEDFGGEDAVDPRLRPLQELRAKLSKDKE